MRHCLELTTDIQRMLGGLAITQSLLAYKLVAKEAALFDGFLGDCNCFLGAVREASDA